MSIQHITIVGTNHISTESLEVIKKEFLSLRPEIIAVELDKRRLETLLNPQPEGKVSVRAIRQVGVQGFLFLLFGRWMQKKLGRVAGMQPGKEMLYAVELARNNNLNLALVDRPLEITIRRLFKKLTWKERFRFVGEVFRAPFAKNSKEMQELKKAWNVQDVGKGKAKIDISRIPSGDALVTMMKLLRKRYPTFYNVLVDERNHYMTRRLVILAKKNPDKKILCVVGAGHKEGMEELLPVYDKRIEKPS